ncbi:NAD(+) diphosphatase [Parasporobacterium paucivorans]|uniref:NAD(+) diphosphatase n=1 Tax=Parasporobacterium paucivorans DSM 15970 TaxID=1122934 RepID=A0A1M6GTB0_9FIRM|nr:NAD(+) diphosphatase [Parasporobacterium paucivorans]SHJ13112.1 NAD+ diphosphatase [Parasporobacterium paucivorans DSM 15970]
MIQDIEPRIFNNIFKNIPAQPQDLFLAYDGENILIHEDRDKLWYPSFSDFEDHFPRLREEAQFLFTIDAINYYLVSKKGLDSIDGWTYATTSRFRTEPKYWRSFAGSVGWQLNRWYDNHHFCSKCGKQMERSEKERTLYCESCGFQAYPTISPCVIVAVYDGDRLLLTKYAGRAYNRYALVAGFVEIGENLEQAVIREVKEEVGLQVKNLKFYKSQPWPFSDSLLAGFYAELDGNDVITLQEDELALAVWMHRDDITEEELKISLTGEMMEAFRTGTVKLQD